MGSDVVALQNEVDRNYAAFKKMLPDLVKTNLGEFAVLRNKQIVGFFASAGEADKFALEKFDDGLFSIQEVTERIASFGYFSYAAPQD